ncbi:MAG: hypothetical protein J5642_04165 [Bacteroidales bacterium]|nr:hypothetical protein [Bacteroidales bacterium]
MKKIAIFVLCAVAALTIASCRYDEGPYISFRSPETRLVGYWKLSKVVLNGEEMDSTSVLPNNPDNYFAFFSEKMLSVSALDGSLWRESIYGAWDFVEKERKLYIYFTLKNRKYEYTATIKRLTREDLIYEYTDDKGDTWRLSFDSRSSMYY